MEKHHILASHLGLAIPKECYSVILHLLAGKGQRSAKPIKSDVPVSIYDVITETVSVRRLATTKSSHKVEVSWCNV